METLPPLADCRLAGVRRATPTCGVYGAIRGSGTPFTAFEVRPQDVLLRLRNRRLYIKPRVQEYVVGIDSE